MTHQLTHPQQVALATDAGRKNREACIREALAAFDHDITRACAAMPKLGEAATLEGIGECREALRACQSHLDDVEIRLRAGARR